ncbi:hypothetical protein [Neisseria meningitidis]|uniref:hypothetical protein n=1 Tax=Neisseria meningitidis TaxID=487 RepID=UPI0004095EEB|nr:hypothetical protein [Neisseria meningitidis]
MNLIKMPSETVKQRFRRHFRYSGLTKIRTRRRAADSTDSTEPIHLVLQHLRESFSSS